MARHVNSLVNVNINGQEVHALGSVVLTFGCYMTWVFCLLIKLLQWTLYSLAMGLCWHLGVETFLIKEAPHQSP